MAAVGLIEPALKFPESKVVTVNYNEFLAHWSLVLYCCEKAIDLHIIDVEHLPHCNQVASDILFENKHPSHKTIFSGKFFIRMYKEWEDNIIVDLYGKRLLDFCCPLCGVEN